MEINFDQIATVFKVIKAVYNSGGNVGNIITALTGNNDNVTTVLSELEQSVIQGFTNVVTAIQEQSLADEWSGVATSLGYAHSVVKQYQADLSTVSNSLGGVTIINKAGQTIPFSEWCLGSAGNNGSLATLNELVSSATITTITPNVSSLAGIFSTSVPVGNASPLGFDALGTWGQILTNAQSNPAQSLLSSNYKYETQYESVLRLMVYTHSLLGLIYYIHDSALQLLVSSTGSSGGYVSIAQTISDNFGDYSVSGSIWNQFTLEFNNLTSGSPEQQMNNATYMSLPLPPSVAYEIVTIDIPMWSGGDSSHGGGGLINPDCWSICSYPVSLAGSYTNAFFGSLGYIHANAGSGDEVKILALQGSVIQVGPGFSLSNMGLYPDSSFYSDSNNWNNNQFSGVNTYQEGFLTPPATSSSNQVPVITGFQLQMISSGNGGFNIGLALQYGILDVSDPNNPQVTIPDHTFVVPEYSEAKAFQAYTSLTQSGHFDASSGNLLPVLLSNATLSRVENGNNAVVVQVASLIYQADFLQPDKLPPVINATASPGS